NLRTCSESHISSVKLRPVLGPILSREDSMSAESRNTGQSNGFKLMPASLIAITMFFVVAASFPVQAQSAFVRVNQVGYVAGAPKRAYLMATASEAGATFNVRNSTGTAVLTASIGANLGSWGSFPNVYAIDFDSISTAGTYNIVVSGPIPTTSP